MHRFTIRLFLVLAVIGFSVSGSPLPAAERLNFVVFLVDDLGWADIGANNPQTFYETPNVDRIAREGMRFTNGYSANPVCSPSRFALMSGKHPTRHAATNWFSGKRKGRFQPAEFNDWMPSEEVTIAEALREAGYRTFFAGKWHLGTPPELWPEFQGFEINKGGHDRGSPPPGGKRYFSPYGNPRLEDGPEGEHLPDRLANETVTFLRAHQKEPFFAYLSFYSVHTPLIGRPDLVEKYKKKPAEADRFGVEEQVLPDVQDERRVRLVQNHAVYAAMMDAMDQAVGKVLRELDALGLAESTIVCFLSDNGGLSTAEGSPTSNLPLRCGKGWTYEGGIRVPYFIKVPGAKAGTNDTPVVGMDLYPTLLSLAGAEPRPEQHLDGTSLVPLLTQSGEFPERALFWHYPHYSNQGGFPSSAIRRGDWKLIERMEDGRVHLFNLREDVGEQNDLAAANPERVDSLKKELHAWYRETNAQFLEPLPNSAERPWRPF